MDDIFYLQENSTSVIALTDGISKNWHHILFNVTGIVGTNFANTYLYCNQFKTSFREVNVARKAKFKDFTDIYTSFLFNLLGKSLQIKTHTTNL